MSSLLQKTAFLVPFIIGLVITGVILWYARVRNPVRRYRPPFMQLLLAGIVLVMISGAVASFIAKTILTGDEIVKALATKEKRGYDKSDHSVPAAANKGGGESKVGSWDRIKYGDRENTEAVHQEE